MSLTERRTRLGGARYSAAMAFDRTRTVRGALAGSVGAAVWLASQPLDRRLFGVDYDDAELLGRLVARGRPEAQAVGAALHVAERRAVRRRCTRRSRRACRSTRPCAGRWPALLEHLATWPAIALVEPSLLAQRAAPSPRRPGATCCSAPSSASWSGG